MKRIIFIVCLISSGLAFGETTRLGTLPKTSSDSWKKVPGGLTFISQLKQQEKSAENYAAPNALQTAVESDNPFTVDVLIERGIKYGNDIHVKDVYGQNLIHLTIDNESNEILTKLLKEGLNPSEGDKLGITPLHLYLNLILERPMKKKFAQTVIKELLQAGADIHATGTFGVSPWEMVNWRKNNMPVFGADTIAIFLTSISPEEARYAQKGATEKAELIKQKLDAAKANLPLLSYKADALKAEIEKNISEAIKKLSSIQAET